MAGYTTRKRHSDKGLSWKRWSDATSYIEGQGGGNHLQWRDVNTDRKYLSLQEVYSFRTAGEVGAKELREGYLNARSGHEDRPSSSFDNGHEFWTQKRSGWFSHPETFLESLPKYSTPSSNHYYLGVLAPRKNVNGWIEHPVIPPMSPSEIGYYGSRAINQTIPTHPSTSLATIVGELKEGLPSLIGATFLKDQSSLFRNLGGEYLNIEFGWKPFISDFLSILDSVNTASKQLTQYQRDSGRNVRRKYSFTPELSSQMMVQDKVPYAGIPFDHTGASGNLWSNIGLYSHHRFVDRQRWFKGAYTYHIDAGKSSIGQLVKYEQLANRLLGTRITPEVLWELTPWSWLADWVSNIGHVVSNYTAFQSDGLVLRYGYMMQKTVIVDTHTNTGATTVSGRNLGTVTMSLRTERKERVRATPYGFGLNPALFTDRQWAILAALGMTKAPKSLR